MSQDTNVSNLIINKLTQAQYNGAAHESTELYATKDTNSLYLGDLQVGNTISNDQLHALKGYSDKGELLTDSEGLSDVKNYAHSSFDLSKFTKVGSPTVTDDGIASGFSSSSDIVTNYIFRPTGAWEIDGSFTTPATLAACTLFAISDVTYSSRIRISASGSKYVLGYMLSSNNSSYFAQPVGDSAYELSPNTKYYFKWAFSGTQYTLKISTDRINWGTTASTDSTATIYTASTSKVRVGKVNGSYEIFTGSIDLGDITIHELGVPTFSGNVTGIDVVKPDNYTVTGSPTITDDGVASGFSGSNYLTSSYSMPSGTPEFEIYGSFRTGSTVPANTSPLTFGSANYNGILLQTSANGLKVYNSDGSSWGDAWVTSSLNTDTVYYYKIVQNGTNCSFYLGEFSNALTLVGTTTRLATFLSGSSNFPYIGTRGGSTSQYWQGSIDLNAFKIYINGNLKYQPCLRIPYSLSVTGSKVVDSYYKSRVEDMYSQFGYAPYYTLQEMNTIGYYRVGSPTISSDYVASGFSSSNYITVPLPRALTLDKIDIYGAFITPASISGTTVVTTVATSSNLSNSVLQVAIDASKRIGVGCHNNTTWAGYYSPNNTLAVSTKYYYHVYYSNGNIKCDIATTNGSYTNVINQAVTVDLTYSSNILCNGGVFGGSSFAGSIDLKETKVLIDNKIVYRAVTPPSFALPQGEIYGMMSKLVNANSRSIGEIVPSIIPQVDSGLHLLDGSLLSSSGIYGEFVNYIKTLYNSGSYSSLFDTEANWQTAVTTYGVCGKFVYNITNNTVRLPKITGFIEGTADLTALGSLVEAGLPEISGTFQTIGQSGQSSGAFITGGGTQAFITGEASNFQHEGMIFNASASNSIYGNSTTVQPQTVKVLYYIVVANATKTAIQVDIDNVATSLNGKADTDLSNVTMASSMKNTIMNLVSPDWDNKILIASGTTLLTSGYTAPKAGYIIVSTFITNGTYGGKINGNSVITHGILGTLNICSSAPIGAGDVYTDTWDGSGSYSGGDRYFVPMKG